jgi:TatD DNase family protein
VNRFLFYDAHAHLPSPESREHQATDQASLSSIDLKYSVINGTSPNDWAAVLEFAQENPRALPAIGLHPQEVQNVPKNWKELFLQLLGNNSICAIGEIGLDRRNQNSDIEQQLDVFCWQLEQARARNIPVSIHCVKATGVLMNTLRTHDLPSRGIHLHAYNGPVELIPELVELGAYFSFAAKQLEFNSEKVEDRIRAVPIQRLLIETDATYRNDFTTLHNCYTAIAEIREMSLEKLSESVAENFKSYFLTHYC